MLFQEIGAAPTHPKTNCSSLSQMGQHPTTSKMLNHEAPISQTVVYWVLRHTTFVDSGKFSYLMRLFFFCCGHCYHHTSTITTSWSQIRRTAGSLVVCTSWSQIRHTVGSLVVCSWGENSARPQLHPGSMIPVKSKAEKIPMIFFVTKVSLQIKVLLNTSFHSNRRYKTSLIEMSKKREREKQQQQQQQSKKNKYTYTYTHKGYIIPLAQRT